MKHSIPPVLLVAILALFSLIPGRQVASQENGRSRSPTVWRSGWDPAIERVWAGSDFWTNPLEDWRVQGGALRCAHSGGDRKCVLLTRTLAGVVAGFRMSVDVSGVDPKIGPKAWIGFQVGLQGAFNDYRDSAVRGTGLCAGIDGTGRLFIGSKRSEPVESIRASGVVHENPPRAPFQLRLTGEPKGNEISLRLEIAGGTRTVTATMDPAWMKGLVALVCSAAPPPDVDLASTRPMRLPAVKQRRGGNARCSFREWRLSGDGVRAYPDRAWGPILWTQYTLSERTLTLTAQLAPIGNGERDVILTYADADGSAKKQTAKLDALSRTATFRVEGWDDRRDVEYSVSHVDPRGEERRITGKIRRNPRDVPRLKVAAFTGNDDVGFPHADIVAHVTAHDPDFLFFSGDQVYERVGGYGVLRVKNVERAMLNYLRKWYVFGWVYRDLLRDRPSVAIPDDHDVFQSNIWGHGGRASPIGRGRGAVNAAQDHGGYTMPPAFVNAVQRTQTSHLPPPFDPSPVEQGIGVYYTGISYGGVSFAVIEDRKWKSGPSSALPAASKIWNGWAQNRAWDARTQSDVEGAVLLGDRQLRFLEEWARVWPDRAEMKCVLSQTIFANVATLPTKAKSDAVTPKLTVYPRGGYAEGERPVQDHDSNGWPQTGRNRALRAMRKSFAFHIAGDQHLGSTVQYGVDAWGDAGFALCVPSVANLWPRRWFPAKPGQDRPDGAPRYAGKFFDGFGNRMTVHAVSNPHDVEHEPGRIHDRAPGYGIVVFDKAARTITCANWPRWVDPQEGAKPYPGWPITCTQMQNYGRAPAGWLPTIEVTGMENPVVQVVDQKDGSLVYALRIRGRSFRPMVFNVTAEYSVSVGEPGTGRWRAIEGLRVGDERAVVRVTF